jgi:hypothetical protein
MGIVLRVNQLNIDSHLIGRFLDSILKDVRYTKLLGDLGEITRLALVPLRSMLANRLSARLVANLIARTQREGFKVGSRMTTFLLNNEKRGITSPDQRSIGRVR